MRRCLVVLIVVTVIGGCILAYLGYRLWRFTGPTIKEGLEVASAVGEKLDEYNVLNPVSLDADPAAVASDFDGVFRVPVPSQLKGALHMKIDWLKMYRVDVFALIPVDADPEEIFEPAGQGLNFNPGPHTMVVATHMPPPSPRQRERARRDVIRMVNSNADPDAAEKVFVGAGTKRIAAYREVAEAFGQSNLAYHFFLDDGYLIYVMGPEDDFRMPVLTELATTLTAKHPANELLYTHPTPEPRDPNDPCALPGLEDPFEIHAVGVRRGSTFLEGVAVDPSEDETYEEFVAVGRTAQPVVLVLLSNRPAVWRLEQTADARIAGVLATGSRAQRVLGVADDTPLRERLLRRGNECDGLYASEYREPYLGDVEDRIWQLFRQEIVRWYTQHPGDHFRIGKVDGSTQPLGSRTLDDVILNPDHVVLPGKLGLAQLTERGNIRPATEADLLAWLAVATTPRARTTAEKYLEVIRKNGPREGVYTVLAETDLPDGMGGANSRKFVVLPGVPAPTGPQGHNTILFGDGTCLRCR